MSGGAIAPEHKDVHRSVGCPKATWGRCIVALALLVLGAASGPRFERVWVRRVPIAGVGSPAVLDADGDGQEDIALAGGLMGRWGATGVLNARTGRLLWKRRFEDELYVTPGVVHLPGRALVVTGGRDLRLHAFDAKTGEAVWTLRRRAWR